MTFIVLIYGYLNVKKWEVSLEQNLYEDPVQVSKTTKYQHLTITHNKYEVMQDKLLLNQTPNYHAIQKIIHMPSFRKKQTLVLPNPF